MVSGTPTPLSELRQNGARPPFQPATLQGDPTSTGLLGRSGRQSPLSASPIGSLRTPLSSPSLKTIGSEHHNTVAKVAQLSSQLHDMDHDLEGQTVTRKQRDMRLGQVQDKIVNIQTEISQMTHRSDKLEGRVSRLEAELAMEKQAREDLDRNLRALIEQKTSELSMRLQQESSTRVSKHEECMGNVKSNSERCQQLMHALNEQGESLKKLEQFAGRVADRTNTLQSTLSQESQSRMSEADKNFKKLASNISSVSGEVERLHSEHYKSLDTLQNSFAGEVNQIKQTAAQDRREVKVLAEKMLQPLAVELRQLQDDFALELRQREKALQAASEKLNYAIADLSKKTDTAVRNADNDLKNKHQMQLDKIWAIQQAMEREKEARMTAQRDMEAAFDKENEGRRSSEEAMTQLVQQAMGKIKAGIEPRLFAAQGAQGTTLNFN